MKIANLIMNAVAGVTVIAASARADVFSPHFPVVETHSVNGANTAGPLAAGSAMGVQGFIGQRPPNWEVSLIGQCASQPGSTVWPTGCNPSKMAAAIRAVTSTDWLALTWASTDQTLALNTMVSGVRNDGSPVVLPIFGQADHWVTVSQITASQSGNNSIISNVKFFDGGPAGGADGSGNGYQGGLQSYSGSVWRSVYSPIASINPACDPCTTDPFYGRFVLMMDPPPGHEHTDLVASFPRAPGVVAGGMTELLARALVWHSLTTAGIQDDPQLWNAIRDGRAGAAVEVNAVAPSGERWDYFLVPILSAEHTAVAFVQLAADDGAFETVLVPPAPSRFDPVSRERAEHLARKALRRGESLSAGLLTWDPRRHTAFAKSPTAPYYEFGVIAGDQETGVVRVDFTTGAVERASR